MTPYDIIDLSKLFSGNGLSSNLHQAIARTDDDILSIASSGKIWYSFDEITAFFLTKCIWKCRLQNILLKPECVYKFVDIIELVSAWKWLSGARPNIKTVFPRYGGSQDRLIFDIGIPILVRRHLYIETATPPPPPPPPPPPLCVCGGHCQNHLR